ncbi:MAG: HlyD family secretion protein [Oscillospiraceae bacterium]|jgi:multidrug resistance efflux pump|nr:HlyD family secretion protein [Oscillospiraceae bacterium]
MTLQSKTLDELKDSRLLYSKKIPAFGYMIILVVLALLIGVLIWSILTPKPYVVKANGVVESENKNYIMSAYSGEISKINIENGSYAKNGETLLVIKNTDLELQKIQISSRLRLYEKQVSNFELLEKSIKENKNYFDYGNSEEIYYYNQFEAYKSQIAQNTIDISSYEDYGYSDMQIENEITKNQNQITEIYYSMLSSIADKIMSAQSEIEALKAQEKAIEDGLSEYNIKANATGIVYMSNEYKVGMVVQAGTAIGSISQVNDKNKIIIYLNVNDVPRVEIGNEVNIAVSGLIESTYGTISGELVNIDTDVTTSQSENQPSYFKATIMPKQDYLISKSGRKYNLTNGTMIESRIIYDEITYFEYFLESIGLLSR